MRVSFRAACLTSTFLLTGHVLGDAPRVWLWAPAGGDAAMDPMFIPLTFVAATPSSTGEAVADAVCDSILQSGATSGRIGILIQNWGRGTLVGNPLDGVTAFPGAHTPWTMHGRAQMGAWMDAFIARYRARQASQGIPDPSRWHLDCELRLPALCYPPNLDPCWGTLPVQLFAAMQADGRWSGEELLVSPAGVPTGMTLAQHWSMSGSPAFDPAQRRDHPSNHAWSRWWDSMAREAVDGALHASFYSKVQAEWPASRCSDFAGSMRIDGGTEPDGSIRQYIDFEWWDRGWMTSRWNGRGALQAPALYVFGETFFPAGEDPWRANMRLHRANLDACLHSHGGVPSSEVTPWVMNPGVALPYGLDGSVRDLSDDEFLEQMALLRGRGIDEFMMWPAGASARWDATRRGIRASWDCDLHAADANGMDPSRARAALGRADRDAARIVPDPAGWVVDAAFRTPALTPGATPGSVWVAMEAARTGSQEVSVSVDALHSSGSWTRLGTVGLAASLPGASWIGPVAGTGLVRQDGSIVLRVSAPPGALPVVLDLLQVARVPGTAAANADIDGNGLVNGADLGMLLGDWSSSAVRSDLDGNGTVGGADLGILLGQWSP